MKRHDKKQAHVYDVCNWCNASIEQWANRQKTKKKFLLARRRENNLTNAQRKKNTPALHAAQSIFGVFRWA